MSSSPPPPAGREAARAPQRHTTRALRAVRPLVTLSELGALYALVEAGLSYETGAGIVSYSKWAEKARLTRRQVMRYGVRFAARGILVREERYWRTMRPAGDKNRANAWQFPILTFSPPEDPELRAFLEATQLDAPDALDFDDAGIDGPTGAQDAPADAAPPALADTPKPAVQAAARAAADASCGSGPGDPSATRDTASSEVACVLSTLREFDELATVATEIAATRIWRVALRNSKTLATTQQAIRDAADKAAGRTGAALEQHLISFVRAARAVEPAAARAKSPEDKQREREQLKQVDRRLDELAAARRAQRARAAAALAGHGRGPPEGGAAS